MPELDALAVLKEARALLALPEKWTKNTSARDDEGNDLVACLEDEYDSDNEATLAACIHPAASCWCLGGAITHVAGENIRFDDERFAVLWQRVDRAVGPWNDRHEHTDVLRVLDETIAEMETSRVAA